MIPICLFDPFDSTNDDLPIDMAHAKPGIPLVAHHPGAWTILLGRQTRLWLAAYVVSCLEQRGTPLLLVSEAIFERLFTSLFALELYEEYGIVCTSCAPRDIIAAIDDIAQHQQRRCVCSPLTTASLQILTEGGRPLGHGTGSPLHVCMVGYIDQDISGLVAQAARSERTAAASWCWAVSSITHITMHDCFMAPEFWQRVRCMIVYGSERFRHMFSTAINHLYGLDDHDWDAPLAQLAPTIRNRRIQASRHPLWRMLRMLPESACATQQHAVVASHTLLGYSPARTINDILGNTAAVATQAANTSPPPALQRCRDTTPMRQLRRLGT